MSDEKPPIPPETETIDAEPVPAETPPDAPEQQRAMPRRRRQPTLVPWVYALALVVLAGAVAFLWWHPVGTQSQPAEAERVAALEQQVQALNTEVKQLAARPAGQPQEISDLRTQLAALAARPSAAPDLAPLQQKVASLEQQVGDLRQASQQQAQSGTDQAGQAAPAADLAPLQQKVASLEQQVAGLTQASQQAAQSGSNQAGQAAPAADLAPLQQKVVSLEQQVGELRQASQQQAQSGTDQAGLAAQNKQTQERLQQVQDRLAALSQQVQQEQEHAAATNQQVQDHFGAVNQQIAALSGRIDGFAAWRDDMNRLDQKLDQLGRDQQQKLDQLRSDQQGEAQKVQALADAQKSAEAGVKSQIEAVTNRIESNIKEVTSRVDSNQAAIQDLRGSVQQLDAGLNRATVAAQAQAALAALAAGRPVGAISGAPPAVARYAKEPPPTLPELRRSFEAVAAQAQAVSHPSDQNNGFLDRVWNRAQGLVTVRQGDQVIVGDPAAGILAHAREDLDAGDLAGAVDTVSKLTGPAAQAMAGWLQSARSVLAARTALIGMTGQS